LRGAALRACGRGVKLLQGGLVVHEGAGRFETAVGRPRVDRCAHGLRSATCVGEGPGAEEGPSKPLLKGAYAPLDERLGVRLRLGDVGARRTITEHIQTTTRLPDRRAGLGQLLTH
jgi:hypothetical protein